MASEVGSAYVTLIPSAKGFASKMNREIGGDLSRAGAQGGDDYSRGFTDSGKRGIASRAKGMFSGLAKAGGLAVAAAGVAVGKVFVDSIGEAREAAVVTARTENVIKKMGNAANISASQVADLAGSISAKAGMDDEAIQSGANLLLTFGNVRNEAGKGNDIFSQTTQLMTDMSAAMGSDVKGSAIQLGKALNDPVKGVSALSRVGVSFTEQQKEQIAALVETGDTLGAQKIVLGEVEKQFGGAAAAMATPADKAKVAWGNFQEELGTALLPLVDRVLTGLANALPKVMAFGKALYAAIAPVVARIIPQVQEFFAVFSGGGGGNATLMRLRDTALEVFGALRQVVVDNLPQIKETFTTVFNAVRSIVTSAVSIITSLWNRFGANIVQYLRTALSSVLQVLRGAFQVVQGIFQTVAALLKGDWKGVWEGIKTILRGAWNIIVGLVRQGWNTIRFAFKNIGPILLGLLRKLWDGAKALVRLGIQGLVNLVKAMPRLWLSALSGLGRVIGSLLSKVWSNARDIVSRGVSLVVDGIKALPGKLMALGSKFLSTGKALIGKFVDGIKNASGIISGIAGNVWDTLRGLINGAIDKLNSALEFEIGIPGPNIHFNLPDISHLATGGRATGATLAVIGEGREPETVLPDSVLRGLLERTAAAATGPSMHGKRLALVLADGTQLDAYIDERINASADLAAQSARAMGRA
jgi:phage-related protein